MQELSWDVVEPSDSSPESWSSSSLFGVGARLFLNTDETVILELLGVH